jgi:hypothetical protein
MRNLVDSLERIELNNCTGLRILYVSALPLTPLFCRFNIPCRRQKFIFTRSLSYVSIIFNFVIFLKFLIYFSDFSRPSVLLHDSNDSLNYFTIGLVNILYLQFV